VLKVHPEAKLELHRVTIQGGLSPQGQGGGGILSQGFLKVSQSTIRDNVVPTGRTEFDEIISEQTGEAPIRLGGGGIAAWAGSVRVANSWMDRNQSDIGAGIFLIGNTDAIIERSTISNNVGGGIETLSTKSVIITNSTFSANLDGKGALAANLQGAIRPVAPAPPTKSRTPDGRYLVFGGVLRSNVPEDTNGLSDVYLFDSLFNTFELISVSSDGVLANGPSDPRNVALISNDGRFVVFESQASNLVADDTNLTQDIFIRDRADNVTSRIHLTDPNLVAEADLLLLSISDDASRIVFSSRTRSIAGGPGDGQPNVYVHDVESGETIKITEADDPFFGIDGASISGDGNFIAYGSNGRNIVPDDFNNALDVFVYDVAQGFTERVSVTSSGLESNGLSFNPSLSGDGGLVYFYSDATNLDPSNPVQGTKEFVHDRVLRETFLRSAPADAASIFADQVTIFDDRVNDQSIVTGRVTLSNTLLSVRSVNPLADSVTRLNVIGPERFGVHLVSPLVALESEPPVHELLADNPAIDAGTGRFDTDQRGRSRIGFADVGATEAVSGSFTASLFVDFNGNQRRESREPGLDNVVVRVHDQSGRMITQTRTSIDDRTTEIDEHGQFQFLNLESGVYQFVFDIPESFQLSQAPFVEVRRSAEPSSTSRDSELVAFSSSATNLVVGDRNAKQDIFVLEISTNVVQRVTRGLMGQESNGDGSQPSMSADGRYVVYTSDATNLAVSDDEGFDDVFIFDRLNAVTTRMSVGFRDLINRNDIGGNGDSHSPRVSPDGSKVVFVSSASNLVSDDSNGTVEDVFVYDILRDKISRVSGSIIGAEFESRRSLEPVISFGGNSVALTSKERFVFNGDIDINPDEVPLDSDILFFRASPLGVIDPISIAFTASTPTGGGPANGASFSPAMDDQGRFLTFVSEASNLLQGDENGVSDIFVRLTQPNAPLVRLMPDKSRGIEADGPSHSPSMSGDGRFIVFVSSATNWVSGQNNQHESVYVFSGVDGRIKRLSETVSGASPNGDSRFPVFSPDGQFVTFTTDATNLFTASTPPGGGTVTVPNPFIEPSATVEIRSGQQIVGRSFGLAPKSGRIAGRIFFDEFIANRQFDVGEIVLADHELFLDLNLNGRFDAPEPLTRTNNEGNYVFNDVPALREIAVVVAPQVGFEQVTPDNSTLLGLSVLLPAGGIVNGFDVGFRSVASTGQSSDSTIRGRVRIDNNRNGLVDAGDEPAVKRVVYMDAGKLGIRDFDDPQVETDANGFYEFTGLPATVSPLLVLLDETLEQTDPVGSLFDLQKFPLQDIEKREGNPQAVVTGLFDDDTFPDVAVLLAETNTLSIRLNDGRGGFLPQKLDVDLSDFVARRMGTQQPFNLPNSIVTGNFDGITGLDVAITGNDSGNILVLRNFDAPSFDPALGNFGFSDVQLITSGNQPLDIVAGQFAGDAATDLMVLNKGDDAIRILTNNGLGSFTAGVPIPTGGFIPASIVATDFTRDGKLDLAVTHSATSLTNFTAGRVTVLVGDGNGGLVLSPNSYTVQANARDSAVGDFNGDDHPDLAVVNFDSQSISILLNQPDGTLRVQTTTLGTTQGAVDIAVADIDNDGDDDILATKLQRREVAIFRNITDKATGIVRFEPQESIGVSRFTFSERVPFALADLDLDTSGPNGKVTIDIVAVPQDTDTLFVLKNTLVQGSRRAAVSGARTDIASGVDFLVQPRLPGPSVVLSISDAMDDSQRLRNVDVVFDRSVNGVSPEDFSLTNSVIVSIEGSGAEYSLLVAASSPGPLTIQLPEKRVFDDRNRGNLASEQIELMFEPEGTSQRILTGANETLNISLLTEAELRAIRRIDIRGTGDNTLVLDSARIRQFTPGASLAVIANAGDEITFSGLWTYGGANVVQGQLERLFSSDGATVRVIGPRDWTNPYIASDVNGNGLGTAADALAIINALGPRQVIDQSGVLVDPTTIAASLFKFYDPNADGRMSAADALFVINRIDNDRQAREVEFIPVLTGNHGDEHHRLLDESVPTAGAATSTKISSFGPVDSPEASETRSPTTTWDEPSSEPPPPSSNDLIDAAIEDLFSTPTN
jgi:Tol biopolymer transport system component